jgi:serine/threonine protein kinase
MERGASLALRRVEQMTPERYQQVNQLFHEALEQVAGRREEFLERACGGDRSLRVEVERMLAAHERVGSFLNAPAVAAIADSLTQPTDSLIGREFGHYRILSPLGAGGMGEVFLAEDTTLERRVALKLLPPEFTTDHDRVGRFEREAKAASALNHPNIVTIHEIGRAADQAGELHFIAEEFIEGQTLRRQIKQGRLPLSVALDIAAQAANALQAAHAANIVHRDIKPENIMLRPDGFIKVLDFGLAKLIEPQKLQSGLDTESPTFTFNRTLPGTILGTAAYMSPEQARGLEIDARSDIWSLGVVLYEMLTGQAPFKGETITDIIVSIVGQEPPPLSQSLSQAPPELERIVMKSLAKSCDERYQTAKDLAIDLKKLKQRLEFDAELARFSNPETTGAQFQTDEYIVRRTAARVPAAATSPKTPLPRLWLITAILLMVSAIGFFIWSSLQSNSAPPAPERRITYSLTVQKMRDGKEFEEPFESTASQVFDSGWKFRLNLTSPQSGHLYLLNENLAVNGAISFYLLFPFPTINNGSAQMIADQRLQTGWYVMSERKGAERLWLVWSAQPAGELEAVKGVVNPKEKGLISNPSQLYAVREFLNKHNQSPLEVETEKSVKQTNVRGREETIVHLIELEHR